MKVFYKKQLPKFARLIMFYKKHAPLEKRDVRAKKAPFIDTNINKYVIKRSRLRNKLLNTKSDIDH